MSVFIRKGLRLGPLRFNLSKRGVGVSVGVRGFHVGLDAMGRGYVSAGQDGIYLRHRLKDEKR